MTLHDQLVPGKDGFFTLGDLKTPASVRAVRLTKDLAETLATFLAVNPPDVANGLLFHESGRPISNSTWDHQIKAAQRRAGVATFRIHDLRHHCASVLIAARVPVPAITQQLGHASPQVTTVSTRTCCVTTNGQLRMPSRRRGLC